MRCVFECNLIPITTDGNECVGVIPSQVTKIEGKSDRLRCALEFNLIPVTGDGNKCVGTIFIMGYEEKKEKRLSDISIRVSYSNYRRRRSEFETCTRKMLFV